MKYLIVLFGLVSFSTQAQEFSIRFEPLYGIEHTQNQYPRPARYSTRTFFGARVLAGLTILSLEVEATQANGRRDFPSENQKAEDQAQRLMVGLRSTLPTSNWLGIFGRAGVRASKEKTTITDTVTNEKTTKEPPLQYDPYAGAGVQLALSSILAASVGATYVFVDGGKPDVQYTAGLTLKFGQVR